MAPIPPSPLDAYWVQGEEIRSPQLELTAHRGYWDRDRGPRLERVLFRNNLHHEEALELCLTTEGEVDLVTEVRPAEAEQVRASSHAGLVAVDANRVMAGLFNRWQQEIPFSDWRVREAFNLAVDRRKLIAQELKGYGRLLPALTPPWAFDFPPGLEPKPFDPLRARQLLAQAGWPAGRPLRIAAMPPLAGVAGLVAGDLTENLGIPAEVSAVAPERSHIWMQALAEKRLPPAWDLLLVEWQAFFLEGTPAFLHREFFGQDGALRAGPVLPEFERLYEAMVAQADWAGVLRAAQQVDRFAYDQALALFLGAPQALYAVNRHVRFRPYRTTFELADTEVTEEHWSRTGAR